MNLVVVDIETLHLVGDRNPQTSEAYTWSKVEDLGMAVGCTWSSNGEGYRDWLAADAPALLDYLTQHDLVVSYNGLHFDLVVLWGAAGKPKVDGPAGNVLMKPHHDLAGRLVDLWADLREATGRMVSLQAAAEASTGHTKTNSATDAPVLWRKGQRLEVIKYCRGDVTLTRELYFHGLAHGQVRYFDRKGRSQVVGVQWRKRDAWGKPVGVMEREAVLG